MRKLFTIFLTILMCFYCATFVGCNQGATTDNKPEQNPNLIPSMPSMQSEGLVYELNETGTAYVMSGIGVCNDANIRIADEYNGLPVTKISASAFAMHPHPYFASITLGKNIAEIDEWAFSNLAGTDVATFYVPEENTFYKVENNTLYTKDGTTLISYAPCQTESSFTLPNTVTHITKFAFNGNSLTNITIPEGVTTIGEKAFAGSKNLTALSIPSSVNFIGERISMYSSIKEICVAENNETYKSVDGVLYSKDGTVLLDYPSSKDNSSFEIPSFVTSIADNAFTYNEKITSITFGASVVTIGTSAFSDCASLATVIFPEGWDCSITSIGNSAFARTALMSIALPWRVEVLESFTFSGCSNLTNVELTLNLRRMGMYIFSECNQLLHIEFEGSEIDWAGIEKDDSWTTNSSLTKVICTDMEITLS